MSEAKALQILERLEPNLKSRRRMWENWRKIIDERGPFNGSCQVREIVHPEIQKEIDAILARVRKRLADDSLLKSRKWSFEEVEIDGLVSIQNNLNFDVSQDMVARISSPSDILQALKLALVADIPDSDLSVHPEADELIVESSNQNLAFCRYEVEGKEGLWDTGESLKAAQIVFACLLTYVRVVSFDGRFYLRDGYHRVFGLRKKGFTFVPCILIQGEEEGDIRDRDTGVPMSEILSPNPPLVKDFLQNAVELNVPKLVKRIHVSFRDELIPA